MAYLAVGIPTGRGDFGVQLQVGAELVTLRAAFEILQDLGLRRPHPRPVRVEVERVRIQVRLHVAGQSLVGVDPPRAADAVLAVEDGEVGEAGPPQEASQRQPTWTGADDSDRQSLVAQPICRHWPPSTTSSEPVMNDACSDTRNATASAISVGVPIRPSAACAARRACVASSSIGVATGPGNTAFTRIPDAASSAAAACVRPRSAHFEEPYAMWLGNGRMAPVLQVFTM